MVIKLEVEKRSLLIVLMGITVVPGSHMGMPPGVSSRYVPGPQLAYYFVWAFPICHELVALSCMCHNFCTVKDNIPDLDGVGA